MRVAINGFGRIGRLVFRAAMNQPGLDIVAVNDLTDNATLAHLLKFDSILGRLPQDVSLEGDDTIVVGNAKFKSLEVKEGPAALPWGDLGADVVWSDNLILAGITEFRVGAEAYEGVAMLFDATTGAYLQTLARPPGEDVGIFPTRIAMAGGRILLSGLDDDVFVGGDAYLYERRAD